MGVPKFFRYISERYPCLSELVKEYQIPEFDHLYLDMNGIIHMCSHPNDFDPHFRISEEQIFKDIFHYIEILFRMIQPQRLFFMAVDGVAPRAKMNQQRGRRFRSAKEAEVLENKARERGEELPNVERFDSNCITPGTGFMVRLQAQLKYFVTYKVSTDKIWQKVKVILSGHETPGEGEHKIMDYIRFMKSQPGYDSNTRHCLYGLDADLIMLGLCTHEPHFALLREEVKFGKKQKRISTPEETTFYLLHLSLMREYLDLEFQKLKTTLPFPYDMENIVDDWVLMGFLVGNDFIPHLPDLHIDKGALPMLYQVYIDVLPSLGGYINEGGILRLERFQKYLEKLAAFDLEQFKETYADIKFLESKTGRKAMKEPEEPVKNSDLAELIQSSALLLEASDDDSDNYVDIDSDEESTFFQEFSQHKNDYYMNKLEYAKVTPDVLRSQAECYVRAIQWNLNYYYNGCCSWSWFYPHHYAPYISDIKDFSNLKLQYDLGTPFFPFQQLLAVLPAASKTLLPEPLQELMVDSDSPLIDFYPTEFRTDMNGKRQEWEGVVLIPFIDQDKLLKAMDDKIHRLTEEEKIRNSHGPMNIYMYTKENLGIYLAPAYFPSLENHHAKEVKVMREEIHVDREKLVKGLCPGVKLDVYFPGFPTLKHIAFTASLNKNKVKVFEQPSRGENMILKVTPQGHPDVSEVANQLVGKTIYVSWPHLVEAKVVAVANQSKRFSIDYGETDNPLRIEDVTITLRSQWDLSKQGIEDRYLNRLGVDIGKTEILVYCCNMEGRKYIFSQNGKITFEKQWCKVPAAYALQTTVRDIAVHDPVFIQHRSLEEAFPVNTICFVLGPPHYGSMGVVMEGTKNGRVKLNVSVTLEPDLNIVRKSLHQLRMRYMPANVVAQRLGIGTHLLSRITGSIFVVTGASEERSHRDSAHKLNIGLNLKFNKKNEEVCGFTRRENGIWLYSTKALELVKDFMTQFPELFEYFGQNTNSDSMQLVEIFPENTAEKLASLTVWLKEQPGAKAEKQVCGAEILEEEVVDAIEKAVDRFVKSNDRCKTVTMQVKPHLLYQPKVILGKLSPDSSATHYLFDRVVNVRECYTVPLGLKGTIIGIYNPVETTYEESFSLQLGIHIAEKVMDIMYDVLFDREFAGGLKLRCGANRGYRMSGQGFLNLSYGMRADTVKTQVKPTAIVQPSGSTVDEGSSWGKTGHNSAFASWRNKSEPSKPQQPDIKTPHFIKAFDASAPRKSAPVIETPSPAQSRSQRSSQSSEARNEFQAMWTELQKAGSSQNKNDNMPKTGPIPSLPQPELSSLVLKKMLKIADDATPKSKTTSITAPVDKPMEPSYCIQLLTHFQKLGLGLPTYGYIKDKDGFLAKVICNQGRTFSGLPAAYKEDAAESAAKAALDVLKSEEKYRNLAQNFQNLTPLQTSRPPLIMAPPHTVIPNQALPTRLIMGRGRSRTWSGVPTPPTPPQQWYQQHNLYQHLPENVPLNWQQKMGSPGGMRMPNHMNIARANFVTPFQQPHQPRKGSNDNWWQMPAKNPFVPLQADKKMRQYRGEIAEKHKEPLLKDVPTIPKIQQIKENPQPSSPSTSFNSQPTQRKSRIAANFLIPIDDDPK